MNFLLENPGRVVTKFDFSELFSKAWSHTGLLATLLKDSENVECTHLIRKQLYHLQRLLVFLMKKAVMKILKRMGRIMVRSREKQCSRLKKRPYLSSDLKKDLTYYLMRDTVLG